VFDPNELKKFNDLKNINFQKYKKIVKWFKNKFTKKRYKEKNEDYRILIEKIQPHLSKMNSVDDVCKFILQSPPFAVTITLLRIAQFILLIPATTVDVESAFSVINNTKDENRNCLCERTLNFIIMTKINIDENMLESILDEAANNWLNSKKRRNLSDILGRRNKKYVGIDDNIRDFTDDDANIYSALYLSNEIQKEDLLVENPFEISEEEDISDYESPKTFKHSFKKGKRKKNDQPQSTWEDEYDYIEKQKGKKRRFVDKDE
jgi:hypothetical protein